MNQRLSPAYSMIHESDAAVNHLLSFNAGPQNDRYSFVDELISLLMRALAGQDRRPQLQPTAADLSISQTAHSMQTRAGDRYQPQNQYLTSFPVT